MKRYLLAILTLTIALSLSVDAAPLNESFEADTLLPAGWQRVNADGAAKYWRIINFSGHTGTHSAYIFAESSPAVNNDWLITPPLYPQSPSDSIALWLKSGYTGDDDSIQLWISTSDSNPASFSRATTFHNTTSAWHREAYSLAGFATTRIFIAFVYRGQLDATHYSAYLDDVTGPELTAPIYTHDMSISAVLSPNAGVVPPLTPFQPNIEVSNLGTATESDFWTRCWISDSLGAVVYRDSLFHAGAMGTGSEAMLFPAFAPDTVMRYSLTAAVTVPVDQSRHNDTLRFQFRTWDRFDLGAIAVLQPPAVVMVADSIVPTVTYYNYGTEAARFSAHYAIARGGAAVASGDTILTISPANSSVVSWPALPALQPVGRYVLKAWTECWRDTSSANDSIAVYFSVSDWERDARQPLPVHRIAHSTVYDPSGDKIYVLAGDYDFKKLANYTSNYRYDPAADSWTELTALPVPGGYWGSAAYCRGRVCYMGGGDFNSGTALAANRVYDIAGDSWSAGAAMSEPVVANGLVAWRDSLVYRIGGDPWDYSPFKTTVQIYDPVANGWSTATPLPYGWAWGGAAILGDTIYLIGGKINAGYLNTIITGCINPASPGTIAWSAGPDMPEPIVNAQENGADAAPGFLFYQGGMIDSTLTTYTDNLWQYDLAAAQWQQLPSLPTVNTRFDNLVFRQGHDEIYVIAGDTTGGYTSSSSVHRYRRANTGIAAERPWPAPASRMALLPPRPNPLRERAAIAYQLPATGRIRLAVYNIAGQQVRVLADGPGEAGHHVVTWDGNDRSGRRVSSGVYFIRLTTPAGTAARKLVVLR